MKREAFEKAIHTDEPSREYLADTIDVDNMAVDSSYGGPKPTFAPFTLDDVLAIAEHMKQQKNLHAKYVTKILVELRKQLKELPSLVDVAIPEGTRINVCGDTHGQYYDLLHIFEIKAGRLRTIRSYSTGLCDRGPSLWRCTPLAFGAVPEPRAFDARNHESLNMNRIYGFEGEVMKYVQTFQLFTEVFHCPLCYCSARRLLSARRLFSRTTGHWTSCGR